MVRKAGQVLLILSLLVGGLLFGIIYANNIFPQKLRFILLAILIIYHLILFLLAKSKTTYLNGLALGLGLLGLIINSFASFYIYQAVGVIDKISEEREENEFSLVVKKESTYQSISDVIDEDIRTGLSQDEDNIIAYKDKLEEKDISLKLSDAKTYVNAGIELMEGQSQVILLNERYRSIIKEQIPDFDEKTRVIDQIFASKVREDIEKEPEENSSFNIYISGIDTFGDISRVSRSDVNLILTINPQSKKMLITTVPRDSYVEIAGGGLGYKDKLTHAGIYGVESSVKTLENLFDIDINYYYRVNFSTFMNLIDVLGGVDVTNDQAFTSGAYTFPQGEIHLDGRSALVFARERYNLERGDLDRGRNQEKVLKAILEKALSPAILFNYQSFLDIMMESTDTNMDKEKILELVNQQLEAGSSWQIDSTELRGSGQMGLPSFAMPNANLYMYVLDEKSLAETSKMIKSVMKE
ncbi:MAG: LCP family protein [Anaerococcus sp.]|nr:LCP family protein [Anaerococcus sp.]